MEALQQLQPHLPPFAFDAFRLGVWLALLVVILVPQESLWAQHPHKVVRRGFLTDLGYYFLNSLLPKLLVTMPLSMIAWGLHHFVLSEVYSRAAEVPLWMRFAAAMIVGECSSYWGHRWMHEIPVLWRFHAIHHSAEEMDWLVNTRAHPLDIVFARLCGFVPMYALGLAQPMMGKTVDVVPLLTLLVAMLWGFFIHANLRWRFGWLGLVIATPAFHHWHHTNDEHVDKNYASMLPIMDALFGSWYMPKKQWPTKYGIDGTMAPGLAGEVVQPFLPEAKAKMPTAAIHSTVAAAANRAS